MGPCRHGRRTQAARLRPARRDEAAALSALVLRSKAFWGYDEAFLNACVEDLRPGADEVIERRTVVAERDGSVVGVATLEGVAPDGVLGLLFVEPGAVLTGVGRRLYRHVLEEAGRLGFDWVTIVSDPHAEGFYRAMGAQRQAAEHSLPVLVGWPIRPEPSWSVAWAPGPSIHIGNVAEFNGQFGPPMGGPDHYSCLAAFCGRDPAVIVLPERGALATVPADAGWHALDIPYRNASGELWDIVGASFRRAACRHPPGLERLIASGAPTGPSAGPQAAPIA